jgi:hypothetical protein
MDCKIRLAIFAGLIICALSCLAQERQIKFVPLPPFNSGLTGPTFIAAADLNKDGHTDLVATDTFQSVAVLLRRPDGTYQKPTIYTLDFYVTRSPAIADIDEDGIPDILVAGGDSSQNTLAFLKGNGDGTFRAPVYFTSFLGAGGEALALADLNGDQHLDVFIGGIGSSAVVLGNGKGSFEEGEDQNFTGFNVALADFNGDGHLDAALTSPFDDSIAVLLGNGDGTFQAPQSYTGLFTPVGVTTGDFNHDGKVDLAVTENSVMLIFLGNGDGTFQSPTVWHTANQPSIVAPADFNQDGNLDLATSDFGSASVTVLTGKGDGTFGVTSDFATGNSPSSIAVADIDHDGSLDLVVTNQADNTITVLLNAAGVRMPFTVSPNPSAQNQVVTLAVSISGTSVTTIPTGTVEFKDGKKVLGRSIVSGGKAIFHTAALSKGSHDITAIYSGDSNFNPRTSAVVIETVN